jgi:predicted aminopeptidase
MSHATIFVKDSIDFNENLATFIGDRGAEKFLISKYGINSPEYLAYINEDKDYLTYVNHMLRGTASLDSLYSTMRESDPVEVKKKMKEKKIMEIISTLDTLTLSVTSQKPSARFKTRLPNNAYFMNFRRYQAKQVDFWEDYRNKFGEDIRKYIRYMSERYPFL